MKPETQEWLIELGIMSVRILGGIFLVALLVVAIGGSVGCQKYAATKREPVAAQCNPICHESCLGANGDTGVRWDGSPVDAKSWDALVSETTFALADKLRVCETRRKACDQCLERLEREKVITQ